MSMLLICDGDSKSELSEELRSGIAAIARGRGLEYDEVELRRPDVPPCTGCLHCLTRHPGVCISNTSLLGLMEKTMDRRFIVFLTPGLFGTFSSTIKNVVDRGGLLIRNHLECVQFFVGYGKDATDEEAHTFTDIAVKHLIGEANIVHPKIKDHLEVFFTRTQADNDRICGAISGAL